MKLFMTASEFHFLKLLDHFQLKNSMQGHESISQLDLTASYDSSQGDKASLSKPQKNVIKTHEIICQAFEGLAP